MMLIYENFDVTQGNDIKGDRNSHNVYQIISEFF